MNNNVINLLEHRRNKKSITNSNKNVFFMLIGIPCSGKSYYAYNNFDNKSTIIISTDELRKELTGTYSFCKENNKMIIDEAKDRIKHYLSLGYNVVYDATNTNKVNRKSVISIVKKMDCEIIGIIFSTSLKTCLERNKERPFERKVPEDKIILMSSFNSNINESEGFHRIEHV